jgi:hypothetical protein
MWRARFGRGFGPVVRQTTKWMNGWRFQVSTTVRLMSSHFWGWVSRHEGWFIVSAVCWQYISPTFKGQAVQKQVNYLTLRVKLFFPNSGKEQTTHNTQKSPNSKDANLSNITYSVHSTAFIVSWPLIFRTEVQ